MTITHCLGLPALVDAVSSFIPITATSMTTCPLAIRRCPKDLLSQFDVSPLDSPGLERSPTAEGKVQKQFVPRNEGPGRAQARIAGAGC